LISIKTEDVASPVKSESSNTTPEEEDISPLPQAVQDSLSKKAENTIKMLRERSNHPTVESYALFTDPDEKSSKVRSREKSNFSGSIKDGAVPKISTKKAI